MSEGNGIKPREPTIDHHGLVAFHDQRCAVWPGESAVLDINRNVFLPSWKAQQHGWRLVQAKGRFGQWVLQTFFKGEM